MLKNFIYEHDNTFLKGCLSILNTEIAACLVLREADDDLLDNDSLKIESSLFLPPHRFYSNDLLIDLLYYNNFTVIDEPPKISFHNSSNDHGITLIAPNKHELDAFSEKMNQMFTLAAPSPGLRRIIKYHPMFATPIKLTPYKLTSFPVGINEIENALQIYQNIFGPIEKERKPITDLRKSYIIQLETSKIPQERLFSVFLALLNIPFETEDFREYIANYRTLKIQCTSFTPSQLKRSQFFRDIISNLFFALKSDHELENSVKQICFNVFMCLIQLDKRFIDHIDQIFRIIKVIVFIAKPKINENSIEFEMNGKKIQTDEETGESIVFWMVLKMIYKSELTQVYETEEKKIFEEIPYFVLNSIPFLHQQLCELYNYEDLSCMTDSICCLFSDLFNVADCVDMWSAALASPNVFDYFQCLIISIFIYNLEIYEQYDKENIPDFLSVVKSSIEKLTPGFLISAAAAISNNSRKIYQKII